ncbi:MAG: alpha/beta hydrolase [Rhizobiales bacterium]|nr:alpha/beta hydrolase [Hyphomicrobiales bacterium]
MTLKSNFAFSLFLLPILFFAAAEGTRAETVTFKAADGLSVTANLEKASSATAIVLFHQAGSSRGEYATIAPRLNNLGYTTLAVDQRSGGTFAGVVNETAKAAAKAGKPDDYADARPDMEAAISYARALPGIKRVVIWGSSYSAALVLLIAGEKSVKVDGALSFSPGEYLRGTSVRGAAAAIAVPTFLSSARSETAQWQPFLKAIPKTANAVGFVPEGAGVHGSSALIAGRSPNAAEYWAAVEPFLKAYF